MALPLTLPITGMTCAACSARVERGLRAVPGVTAASVNFATARAEVAGEASLPDLIGAVKRAGYQVSEMQHDLLVTGLTTAASVAMAERTLAAVPGVVAVRVSLATERAQVSGIAEAAALVAALRAAGLQARPIGPDTRHSAAGHRAAEVRVLQRDLTLAAGLTLPVVILEMGGHLIPAFHHWLHGLIGQGTAWLIQFALTALVLAWPGRRFFASGIPALLRGAPDMSSLVALGAGAAFLYSSLATLAPTLLPPGSLAVYFEAAAVIVTLVLLGRLLEAVARGRSSRAIERLVELCPDTAEVERDGQLVAVPLADLQTGDRVRLRPGARVPVDGRVIDGESWIDEAMVTGEPMPVFKQLGSPVIGGTVNQAGALIFEVTAVGADTLLARIIHAVETAQGGKLPIQALVDRVTLWFVPTILGLAALTFGLWLLLGPAPALPFALVNAVSVLIIACPCAMGLATPVSILVGTGRGAELGVLFRKGAALQALQGVRTIAFDKTGTLTEGRPTLTGFFPVAGEARATLLPMLAAAEAASEHPIARAILAAAGPDLPPDLAPNLPRAEDFRALPGHGVAARVAGHEILLGAARAMTAQGIDISGFEAVADEMARNGASLVYAARDGRLVALLCVTDPIKPSTPAALAALRALGLRLAMVTGDDTRTARRVAATLGIDSVVAEVTPEGKVAAVKALAGQGKLAFVGDGINDAPALAAADVGVAIGTGTDIAIEAAEVVLVSGRLPALAEAILLSRATLANIRQNLFWAFGYNAALIPVAAGALYPAYGVLLSPMLAAAAMGLSSVFVVGNALRLRRVGAAVA